MSAIKGDYSDFIKASSRAMIKCASDFDPMDMINEVASHYSATACGACGMGEATIEGVKDVCGDLGLICRGNDELRVLIVVGTDLSFRGIVPIDGQCLPGSMDHYFNMVRPALQAIGHFRPVGEDFIIFPKLSIAAASDSYDGFDVSDNSPVTITFKMNGGKKTKNSTYSYERSERKTASSSKMKENATAITDAGLVMIDKPGSKYDGMAGSVDASKILYHNDHIEFPVSLEYDTGQKVELWVTDGDVKVYR
jgi:hypothetical protein